MDLHLGHSENTIGIFDFNFLFDYFEDYGNKWWIICEMSSRYGTDPTGW